VNLAKTSQILLLTLNKIILFDGISAPVGLGGNFGTCSLRLLVLVSFSGLGLCLGSKGLGLILTRPKSGIMLDNEGLAEHHWVTL